MFVFSSEDSKKVNDFFFLILVKPWSLDCGEQSIFKSYSKKCKTQWKWKFWIFIIHYEHPSIHSRFTNLKCGLHVVILAARLTEVVGIRQTCQSFCSTWNLQRDEWGASLCLGRQLLGGPQVGSPLGGIKQTSACNTNTTTCSNRVDANSDAATTKNTLKVNFSTKLLFSVFSMMK